MPLTELNHYFVRANDLEQSRRFYCDVPASPVGMSSKPSA
jgi:extradiol dioxygenase family protein